MRSTVTTVLMMFPALGFAAGPRLDLSDPGLPLQIVRPLDRQAFILTLDGKWSGTPAAATHYVNLVFPDGGRHSHRVLDDAAFRRGEVRVLIEEYQLVRHGIADTGQFGIEITVGEPLERGGKAEVVSNLFFVEWPILRKIVRSRPRSRYTETPPLDAFPLPDHAPARDPIPSPRKVVPEGKPKGDGK